MGSYDMEKMAREWHDLDHLLAGLWTSHSILPVVDCVSCVENFPQRMFPELTDRGAVCEFSNYALWLER